jgi:hypothetical protein
MCSSTRGANPCSPIFLWGANKKLIAQKSNTQRERNRLFCDVFTDSFAHSDHLARAKTFSKSHEHLLSCDRVGGVLVKQKSSLFCEMLADTTFCQNSMWMQQVERRRTIWEQGPSSEVCSCASSTRDATPCSPIFLWGANKKLVAQKSNTQREREPDQNSPHCPQTAKKTRE